MALIKNKSTRALIIIMLALAILGIIIAKIYYSGINNAADPRVKPARELYSLYNGLAQENDYPGVFKLLDSIEFIYSQYSHYRDSYETGVVWNNRAASYLTLSFFRDSLPEPSLNSSISEISLDSLLLLSENASLKSIETYQDWQKKYQNKNKEDLATIISLDFFEDLDGYTNSQKERFLNSRIREIGEAQLEIDRRLSVAYTNLGLVYRQKNNYEKAAEYYKAALELWEDNLSAENNLNLLLGKPLRERSIIQKIFPQQRKTKK